ncbi:MAG: 30S ribosomal protein S20 [Acidimicrobiia bacterium]|nr:30S ribosomal protein S20 [Acidimicrobiia bacterium]
MANIKSQIKRNRQNERLRARNKGIRSELKTRIAAVVTAHEAGEDTTELIRLAQKDIDQAEAKGVIKPNNAARKKSRLQTRLNA